MGKVELVPHPKALRRNRNHLAKRLKPQVKLALGMILVAACQEICDVKWPSTQSLFPPTNLLPDNSMFPTWDVRAPAVPDLHDFFRHTEIHNTHHCLGSLLAWNCRFLMVSELPPSHLPPGSHGVFLSRCWSRRPDDLKSGTIWSYILAFSTIDGISHVKTWLSHSPLHWKIL